jgi:hypothetical protein
MTFPLTERRASDMPTLRNTRVAPTQWKCESYGQGSVALVLKGRKCRAALSTSAEKSSFSGRVDIHRTSLPDLTRLSFLTYPSTNTLCCRHLRMVVLEHELRFLQRSKRLAEIHGHARLDRQQWMVVVKPRLFRRGVDRSKRTASRF